MQRPGPASEGLTVFVSSTYIDLYEYRTKIEEALTRIQASFRSMKFFGSKEGDPLDECLRKVGECNHYIGIIGHRYGTIHEGLKKSVTELEYEESKKLGLSRRIYIANASIPIRAEHVEPDEKRALLEAFKLRLKKENSVVEFSSPDDLAVKVLSDIILGLPEKVEIAGFAKDKYLPAIRRTCASISFLGLDIQAMKRHRDVKLEKVYVRSKFRVIRSLPLQAANVTYIADTTFNFSTFNTYASGSVGIHGATQAFDSDWENVTINAPAGEFFYIPKETKHLLLSDLVGNHNNVVILGDPGSGKTTLAKYIVVALVDGLSDLASLPTEAIPVRIPLRAYAEFRQRAGGLGVSILDFMVGHAKTELQLNSLPERFFDFYLSGRKAILIFDGLDEIFDSHLRESVRNDVVNFTQVSFPGNKALVTSRKVGYGEVGFPEPDFVHFEIERFDNSQISEYVQKWYCLEESDRRKRNQEIAAFHNARKNLPEELVRNPLLLSLIVILFRSGCTLPDSKLEIYRSCVGTLTEKWDAAGKRLELPPEYNLIRDKRGAFARIAYWMYEQSSGGSEEQSRLKYPTILAELTRHLCEREFKGREAEAESAAENFLDYAAKRSIFVEDRFSHKTFHEYFAALYIYRNFCLGHTPDELYSEIRPYLDSDYWSVVLELLLVMIDEQAGQLVDRIFSKIMTEVQSRPEDLHGLLLLPLRTLPQLQNVGEEAAASLVLTAVEICLKNRGVAAWEDSTPTKAAGTRAHHVHSEGTPYHRLFASLENLPEKFYSLISEAVRRAGSRAQGDGELLPIAALCVEFRSNASLKVEDVIPNWNTVGESLARLHLGIFYRVTTSATLAERLQQFANWIGTERLFHKRRLLFRWNTFYISVGENALYALLYEPKPPAYDVTVKSIVRSAYFDFLLQNFIAIAAAVASEPLRYSGIPVKHFMKAGKDPREYLVDWVVLHRILRSRELSLSQHKSLTNKLKRIAAQGSKAQRFYSALLLGMIPPVVTQQDLALAADTYDIMQNAAREHTVRHGKLQITGTLLDMR